MDTPFIPQADGNPNPSGYNPNENANNYEKSSSSLSEGYSPPITEGVGGRLQFEQPLQMQPSYDSTPMMPPPMGGNYQMPMGMPPMEPPRRKGSLWWLWVLIALVVAGGVVAVVLLTNKSDDKTADEETTELTETPEETDEDYEDDEDYEWDDDDGLSSRGDREGVNDEYGYEDDEDYDFDDDVVGDVPSIPRQTGSYTSEDYRVVRDFFNSLENVTDEEIMQTLIFLRDEGRITDRQYRLALQEFSKLQMQ